MITENTSLWELKKIPAIRKIWKYLIYSKAGDGAGNLKDDQWTLKDIQRKNPTWKAIDMAYGLNVIWKNQKENMPFLYSVYGEEERKREPEKEDVKLLFFPAKKETKCQKTAILAAGGGYGAVCSLSEAFPVAARMREHGIDVFCLNYRVAGTEPLFPKPMEDLAAAYSYLKRNEEKLGISMRGYAVGGFSAGGHLAACWGTKTLGYRKYGFEKPAVLFLAYPMVNVWDTVHALPEPICSMMMRGYLGETYTRESCRQYDVDLAVDREYPAVYLIQAADDPTVPVWNSERMMEKLGRSGVPCEYEKPVAGGHGFGLGTGSPAEGWAERAVTFWKGRHDAETI